MTPDIEEAIRSGAVRLVPVEASESLLRSMAIRYDHGLGCPGYYDQEMFAASGVTHARRLESAMTTMRQLHEEVVGSGFHRAADDHTPALLALIEERDRLKVERDERDAEITRLQSDRQYVVGWNDGFDHVHGPLRFPTMLRKMWSGGEVQKWLDEQRIEAARVAHADEGSALQAAEARALAAEAKCDALREAAVGAAAALSAAISLLERTPKAAKATPSARMFGQMLSDYRATLEATRCALTKEPDNG